MIIIKFYDSKFNPIISLLENEIDSLTYKKSKEEVGDASFNLRVDNTKISATVLQNYNRIEIIEDGSVAWCGYINKKTVNLNTVSLRCKELSGLLKKRLVADGYVFNTDVSTGVQSLIDTMNGIDDTGILKGQIEGVASINVTFNRETVWSVLKKVAQQTNSQFMVGNDRKLYFKNILGEDLSSTLILKYKSNQLQNSNILSFQVEDDGESIVNTVYGKSGAFNSTQLDGVSRIKYGFIEYYENARTCNTQDDIDELMQSRLADNTYSPALNIRSDIGDFNVGDLLKIEIDTKIVDIDTTYQVIEKTVSYGEKGKVVTVKVNTTPYNIAKAVNDIENRLSLLENNL